MLQKVSSIASKKAAVACSIHWTVSLFYRKSVVCVILDSHGLRIEHDRFVDRNRSIARTKIRRLVDRLRIKYKCVYILLLCPSGFFKDGPRDHNDISYKLDYV